MLVAGRDNAAAERVRKHIENRLRELTWCCAYCAVWDCQGGAAEVAALQSAADMLTGIHAYWHTCLLAYSA
jgi:hypothetical protein